MVPGSVTTAMVVLLLPSLKLVSIVLFMLTSTSTTSAFPRDSCPEVRPMPNFDIFAMLGRWYIVQHYSSSEEAITYLCMRAEFGLSRGNMDMIMKLTYVYANDPEHETQIGNMTWQIPDPRRPEHWRHTEDYYFIAEIADKGVYNTDVIDTDYSNWLIILHCADSESEKKFLSTFVLSRSPRLDKLTTAYLREKIGQYDVHLEYLFPVNQTNCFGEEDQVYDEENNELSSDLAVKLSSTTQGPFEEDGELLYD